MILTAPLRPGTGCAGGLDVSCETIVGCRENRRSRLSLAWAKQLRYNETMNLFRRPRGLLLVLVAVLVVVAAVLVLRGNRREAAPATSPLPTPVDAVETLEPPSQSTSAVVLLWVALGSLLALGVAALILRRSRRDEQ